MRYTRYLSLTILLLSIRAWGDSVKPPTQSVLDSISARGRLLAEYDKAAEFASDEVSNLAEAKPADSRVKRYIAVREKARWKVYFGRLDTQKNIFEAAYVAVQKGSNPEAFLATEQKNLYFANGYVVFAARAIELALKSFKAENRPYNVAALPATDDKIWIYIYPARTRADVWPLGGDVRYLISGNGNKILETRRMHQSILELSPPPEGSTPAAGYHTTVLGNVPEDTDVFHVLSRVPSRPEYVITPKWVYLIQTDGSIKYQGTKEAFAKKSGGQK